MGGLRLDLRLEELRVLVKLHRGAFEEGFGAAAFHHDLGTSLLRWDR